MTEVRSPGTQCEPALFGQTVVVIGGSSGIGLETARQAREAGGPVIVTGRDADRLQRAPKEVDALSTAAFDALDFARRVVGREDVAAVAVH